MARADDVLSAAGLPQPNVMKIDVEGAERDVVDGMEAILAAPALRLVYIEIHFGILARRGRPDDAHLIEASLKRHGYTLSWNDASHILAVRHERR